MRLIHTTTLALKEFWGAAIPDYAILSHCWGGDEVTYQQFIGVGQVAYQQFLARTNRQGDGWRKIEQCCRLARADGLDWAWVDTCCIDKTSTADLSEAINSMYSWYEKATVCYAILPETWGMPSTPGDHSPSAITPSNPGDKTPKRIKRLEHSAWFTRGWTLQELIAPKKVLFFDRDAKPIGSKDADAETLADITGIDVPYLQAPHTIYTASIACRMSWASKRVTTRGEDIAYCLLGLFQINMPMLYGEGKVGAFRRLQEAIISQSDDQTIYAWTAKRDTPLRSSILARSPLDFADGAYLVPVHHEAPPARISSRGIELFFANSHIQDGFEMNLGFSPGMQRYARILELPLACYDSRCAEHDGGRRSLDVVGIKLERAGQYGDGTYHTYHRIETHRIFRHTCPQLVQILRTLEALLVTDIRSIYVQRLEFLQAVPNSRERLTGSLNDRLSRLVAWGVTSMWVLVPAVLGPRVVKMDSASQRFWFFVAWVLYSRSVQYSGLLRPVYVVVNILRVAERTATAIVVLLSLTSSLGLTVLTGDPLVIYFWFGLAVLAPGFHAAWKEDLQGKSRKRLRREHE